MAERLTIKQIAELSGVSVGTVDRILHNRGMVSESARVAVQAVLEKNSYEYNIHTSAVAFRKTKKVFDLVIAIPFSVEGEYWDLIKKGIENGLDEYKDIPTNISYVHFDQFSATSCHEAFDSVAQKKCSAVILGTTFEDEIIRLCKILDDKNTPYVFVDGNVPHTNPVAYFQADQEICGRLLARLMDKMTPKDAEIAILLPRRVAVPMSNNSKIRLDAFKSFFRDNGNNRQLLVAFFSANDDEERKMEIAGFLESNSSVKGIAVVVSTSYLISDAIAESGKDGKIVIGGFDVTEGNARCIKNETLDFAIDQHPTMQGFKAVEAAIHFLLYATSDKIDCSPVPVNVVLKENLQR